MEITATVARRVSVAAWVMAAFGTVAGQLHALARFNSHPGDLEYPLTRFWAEPAIEALRPILEWAHPYEVYVVYGRIWLPICLAFTAAAFLVFRHRRPQGFQRRAWQVQLGAYCLLTLSVTAAYFTPWIEQSFMVTVAVLLVVGLGGPFLAVSLLRAGFRPRTTPWLLIGFLPFFFAITTVTSMGSALLPLMWGWAIAAHRVAREVRASLDAVAAPVDGAATTR